MSWEAAATFALALITLAGVNVGAVRWLLDRHERELASDAQRLEDLQRNFFELRAALPLEYVRREDWIRFSATQDAKLDAIRDEIAAVRESLFREYL